MRVPPEIAAARGASALVTGGAGFIGGHLCALLRAAGWTVHSASRRAAGGRAAHRHWPVDLTDAAATQALVAAARPDYVFHLASHVWGAPDLKHVLPTFHANLHSTVNLLQALAGTPCRRFVITGSLVEPEQRSSEQCPTAPYAAAKWAACDYVRMFHALYRLPGAIARVFMVYGPAQPDRGKLIPYAIGRVLRGEPPEITSGRHLIDWVYVEDVAEGLARMAVTPDAAGRTVDLGTGRLISTGALIDKLCELMGGRVRPIYGALPDRPMEPVRAARTEETRRLLGWSPPTSLEDGLRRTIAWYTEDARERAET
ncbi:MAG TPA: NAD-dependent epimerase/dehydratase family protein [Stellaceae bacterium]|nr:NAD-dependent epimerase/dehydratase family protein [Stellaceae bacterium]